MMNGAVADSSSGVEGSGMDATNDSMMAVRENSNSPVSSTTPTYRMQPEASCEASTVNCSNMRLGLSGEFDSMQSSVHTDHRLQRNPHMLHKQLHVSQSVGESQDPSTMMLKLLHMSMEEKTSQMMECKRSGAVSVVDVEDGRGGGDDAKEELVEIHDEDSISQSSCLTCNSHTVSSQAGTVSMLSVDNEEATLGSVLSERQQKASAADQDEASKSSVQDLQNLQTALRQLIRQVSQQQQGNQTPTAECESGPSIGLIESLASVQAEIVHGASTANQSQPSQQNNRLPNRPAINMALVQQQHNRLIARKKVLMATAAMSNRQKAHGYAAYSMANRATTGVAMRGPRINAPVSRPQQFVGAGQRSSIASALAQSSSNQLPTLYTPYPVKLRGGLELRILVQPEEQHRARYLTEGSRGAVKDRSGNSFPTVKLSGTNQGGKLLVFIGSDQGRAVPHMFYQASKVCGKNSTPCEEMRIDGTTVIQLAIPPVNTTGGSTSRELACDCVGILKERNVDVEKRLARYGNLLPSSAFTENGTSNSKKRSTRCRLVFRVVLDGGETLQTTSAPILCTQPPGAPEICKKSLKEATCDGGGPDSELFIIGKNFLKDTKVYFREVLDGRVTWEANVTPEKEFLQATHLVCKVPPYSRMDISSAVTVDLVVSSGGRSSDSASFTFTPLEKNVRSIAQDVSTTQNVKLTFESANSIRASSSGQSTPQNSLPTIIQIPVISQTSAVNNSSTAPTQNIQFVVVQPSSNPQAVLNLIAGSRPLTNIPVAQKIVSGISTDTNMVIGSIKSLPTGSVIGTANFTTNNDQFAKVTPVQEASTVQMAATSINSQPVGAKMLGVAVNPPLQVSVCDNGVKRKISADDIKPVVDETLMQHVVHAEPPPSACVPQQTWQQTIPLATSSAVSPSSEIPAVWADTRQPMSAKDQAAIQHIATSLAASVQKVEEASEDPHIKKQKVVLQESPEQTASPGQFVQPTSMLCSPTNQNLSQESPAQCSMQMENSTNSPQQMDAFDPLNLMPENQGDMPPSSTAGFMPAISTFSQTSTLNTSSDQHFGSSTPNFTTHHGSQPDVGSPHQAIIQQQQPLQAQQLQQFASPHSNTPTSHPSSSTSPEQIFDVNFTGGQISSGHGTFNSNYHITSSPASAVGSAPASSPYQEASSSPHAQQFSNSPQTFASQSQQGSPPTPGQQSSHHHQQQQQAFNNVFNQLNQQLSQVNSDTPMDCQSFTPSAPVEVPMNVDGAPASINSPPQVDMMPSSNISHSQQSVQPQQFSSLPASDMESALAPSSNSVNNSIIQDMPKDQTSIFQTQGHMQGGSFQTTCVQGVSMAEVQSFKNGLSHAQQSAQLNMNPVANMTNNMVPQSFPSTSLNTLQQQISQPMNPQMTSNQNSDFVTMANNIMNVQNSSSVSVPNNHPDALQNTGFQNTQMAHSFNNVTSNPMALSSVKPLEQSFGSQSANESQVTNITLANQLLASNGITFPQSTALQPQQMKTMQNNHMIVQPLVKENSMECQSTINATQREPKETLPHQGDIVKMDCQTSQQVANLLMAQDQLNIRAQPSVSKVPAVAATRQDGAFTGGENRTMMQCEQGKTMEGGSGVMAQQAMDCQLSRMSMLPESELIRMINPENFVERQHNQSDPSDQGPALF